MPFQDYAADALPGLGALLGGLGGAAGGFYFGGPAGLGAGADLGTKFGQQLGGFGAGFIPRSKTPFQQQAEAAQLELLQGLRTPRSVDFNPIRQQEINRFQQETLPQIGTYFAGTTGPQSSAFQKSLSQAGSDLGTRLASLQAQHDVGQQGVEANRLGQLGNFLSGNQSQALQQHMAAQGGFGQQLGLGRQFAGQEFDSQNRASDIMQRYLQNAQASGLGQAPKIDPTLLQSVLERSPELLGTLLEIYKTYKG